MRVIDKYLTESVVKLDQPSIKSLISSRKQGVYEIDGKKVMVTIAGDTMILQMKLAPTKTKSMAITRMTVKLKKTTVRKTATKIVMMNSATMKAAKVLQKNV